MITSRGIRQIPTNHPYITSFPLTENPISEGGIWINGKQTGRDWSNVITNGSIAYGTQTGAGTFDDSAALVGGSWSPNHGVEATVYSNAGGVDDYQEVEIQLRAKITAHVYTAYSMDWNLNAANAYHEISQFFGPLVLSGGDGNYVTASHSFPGVAITGTVLRAQIQGNILTTYLNGVLTNTINITSFGSPIASGNPGIGFFKLSGTIPNTDFGFSHIRVFEL